MFCRNCGSPLDDGVKFCPNCGEKVIYPNADEKDVEKNINPTEEQSDAEPTEPVQTAFEQTDSEQPEDKTVEPELQEEQSQTQQTWDSMTGVIPAQTGSGTYQSGSSASYQNNQNDNARSYHGGGYEREFRPASWFRGQASDSLKGYFGLALGSYLLTALIGGVFPIILMGPMMFGICTVYLKISDRDSTTGIGDLFSGFEKCFGSALWLYIRQAIFVFLWSLLFVIPGIIKTFSYSMSVYIKADHPEITAREAMEASMRLMQGYKWKLFCLHFSFIGWHLLCCLTCGLLYLWVGPRLQMAVTEFYKWYIRDRY